MTVLTLCLQKPQRAEDVDLGIWVVDKWSVVTEFLQLVPG